jgi:uncharacterized protein YwqG
MPLSLDQLRNELERLIETQGLAAYKDKILASAKPSVRILLNDPQKKDRPNLSYIGGMPTLPEDISWPLHADDYPLAHFAQIYLPDLASFVHDVRLPKTGTLNFFGDIDEIGYSGNRHDETEGWRVVYTRETEDTAIARRPPEISTDVRQAKIEELMGTIRQRKYCSEKEEWVELPEPVLPEFSLPFCPIHFQQDLTIPAARSVEISPLGLEDKAFDSYWKLQAQLATLIAAGDIHRFLGHPDAVQGCMQRTAQFVTNAAYLPKGVHSYYEHPRAKELMPGAHDWQLLLQIGSNTEPSWMWGDTGRIYFWIRKADLENCTFEKTWYFMQS